jgi:hypothetical protein
MNYLSDPSAPLDAEVHTFERRLLSTNCLVHELGFEWFDERDIYARLRCQLTAYLTARELKSQKVEIPASLREHIKLKVYTQFPKLTKPLQNRFPVKWRDIMPKVIQAIDIPILSGHQTQLYVMEPFKF